MRSGSGGSSGERPSYRRPADRAAGVLEGRAKVTVGAEGADVGRGDVVFVAAGVPHRIHDIVEELRALVVFGPAEERRGHASSCATSRIRPRAKVVARPTSSCRKNTNASWPASMNGATRAAHARRSSST